MYGQFPDRFVQSAPHQIYWAGFRSDTYTLQQNGWEFSADQRIERDEIRLAMRHQDTGMHAVTSAIPGFMYAENPMARQHFNVVFMTDRGMKFQYYPAEPIMAVTEATPVDMRPQRVEVKDIEDFKIFGCPLVRTNEVIVDPNSVPDLMDRILELQDPARKEHFMRLAKEAKAPGRIIEPGPQQQFHAQIVSIAA